VDGVSQGSLSSYTFEDVSATHSIEARFEINTYIVKASVDGGNGIVYPSYQVVNHNGTATINITPATGYRIVSITDNGVSVPVANPYVISGVTEDHEVVVTFAVKTYNDILKGDYQTSLTLESTQPVVAERPMYFNYQGTNIWN